MGVDLPRASTEFLRRATARAVRRSQSTRVSWLAWVLVLAAAYAPVIVLARTPAPWARLPWLLAPFLAALTWANAALRLEDHARRASRAFAAAAVAGVVAQVVSAVELHVLRSGAVPVSSYLLLASAPLLAAGGWLALGSRRGLLASGVTADALLIVLAALVAVLRLVVEPVLATAEAGGAGLGIVAWLQVLALPPLFLASVLVLRRGCAFSPASAAGLLGATLAFAAAGMLSLAHLEPQPFTLRDPFDYFWVLGWLLLAFAGVAARAVPGTGPAMLRDRIAYDGVRRMIVPVAALFLAVAAVDVALRPAMRPETVVAIALLGAVLALRTAHAFALTEREDERERQLAYTRALVQVTHALAEASDLDATLTVITAAARDVLRTRGAGIELISGDRVSLETRAAVGLPDGILGMRFPVAGSFTGWVVQHGEPRATADPSTDPYIQPESVAFLGRSPLAGAPIRFRGETMGALYVCMRSEPFDAEELAFLGALAEQAGIAIERARLFAQVTRLSITDPLTGLPNRRALEREIEREFAAARRGRDLVAVLFDLDAFKEFNDTFGHLAGDAALKAFARALQEETRAMNHVSRYGGDEFVALLSGTGMAGGRIFVERVRGRFDEGFRALDRGMLSFSAGVAAFDPAMRGADELLHAADEDLYRQKLRARV